MFTLESERATESTRRERPRQVVFVCAFGDQTKEVLPLIVLFYGVFTLGGGLFFGGVDFRLRRFTPKVRSPRRHGHDVASPDREGRLPGSGPRGPRLAQGRKRGLQCHFNL